MTQTQFVSKTWSPVILLSEVMRKGIFYFSSRWFPANWTCLPGQSTRLRMSWRETMLSWLKISAPLKIRCTWTPKPGGGTLILHSLKGLSLYALDYPVRSLQNCPSPNPLASRPGLPGLAVLCRLFKASVCCQNEHWNAPNANVPWNNVSSTTALVICQ